MKKIYDAYRAAARQKVSDKLKDLSIANHGMVHIMPDKSGAFVEAILWVSAEEAEKHAGS